MEGLERSGQKNRDRPELVNAYSAIIVLLGTSKTPGATRDGGKHAAGRQGDDLVIGIGIVVAMGAICYGLFMFFLGCTYDADNEGGEEKLM